MKGRVEARVGLLAVFGRSASPGQRGVSGGTKEGIPLGLKPQISGIVERPKAEALGYLDARTVYVVRVAFALLILVSCLDLTACAPPRSSRITIGAKNFTEQVVLGELVAQEIEAVSGESG